MFKNSSIMVLLDDKEKVEIFKLETSRETQRMICSKYAEAYEKLCCEKEKIEFNGNYKPESEEILYIENYDIENEIIGAVRHPSSLPAFNPTAENQNKIKAIFVGEITKNGINIVFQKFKKEQYISTKGVNLFFDNKTFIEEKRFGINISNEIDCVYSKGNLLFSSYYMARQVFNLKDYYRIATNDEVENFAKLKRIKFDDTDIFFRQTDSHVRKKIASILDSKVLELYPASEIRKMAKRTGVNINVKSNKIVIPTDKKQMKIILGFLDEEVYKGIFSNDTFITNSKRNI